MTRRLVMTSHRLVIAAHPSGCQRSSPWRHHSSTSHHYPLTRHHHSPTCDRELGRCSVGIAAAAAPPSAGAAAPASLGCSHGHDDHDDLSDSDRRQTRILDCSAWDDGSRFGVWARADDHQHHATRLQCSAARRCSACKPSAEGGAGTSSKSRRGWHRRGRRSPTRCQSSEIRSFSTSTSPCTSSTSPSSLAHRPMVTHPFVTINPPLLAAHPRVTAIGRGCGRQALCQRDDGWSIE